MLALRLQMGNIQASDSRPRHLGKLLLMRSGEGGCLLSWSLGRCPPAGHNPSPPMPSGSLPGFFPAGHLSSRPGPVTPEVGLPSTLASYRGCL